MKQKNHSCRLILSLLCLAFVCLAESPRVVSVGVKGQSETYLVVNLSTGKSRRTNKAPNLSGDACRTTELWLHWIPAGTFTLKFSR